MNASVSPTLLAADDSSSANPAALAADKTDKASIEVPKGGYLPLGYTDDLGNAVWSVLRQQVHVLKPGQQGSVQVLYNVCGARWMLDHYGIKTKSGETIIDAQTAGGDIADACSVVGRYREDMTRGSGVYLDDENPDILIVNSGISLWRTDRKPQKRMSDGLIYSSSEDLDMRPDSPQASTEEGARIYQLLQSWRWKRDTDALLMLGWIGAAGLTGAHDWRSHGLMTGKAEFGKSTLQVFIANLLGNGCLSIDAKTSEAGVRQNLRHNALPILVDEAEAKGKHIKSIMDFLRSSSSGSQILRGSSEGNHMSFAVRAMGMLSAVNAPKLDETDSGRYVRFHLVGAPEAETPDILRPRGARKVRAIGRRIHARMIASWPRIRAATDICHPFIKQLTGSRRYADTHAPIVASAWAMLYDEVMTTEQAEKFVSKIDFSEEAVKARAAKEESTVLTYLLGTVITVKTEGITEQMTIADACQQALDNGKNSAAMKALRNYGIRPERIENQPMLLILESATELVKLFRESQTFAHADLEAAFQRVPGAWEKRYKPTQLGGVSKRPLVLPFSYAVDETETSNDAKGE
jgi:putative DNA primase/helicase